MVPRMGLGRDLRVRRDDVAFPMASVKRAVLDLVKGLPDDSTLEAIQYQLYLRQKLERSLQGRTKTHAEVKKRLVKWLAK